MYLDPNDWRTNQLTDQLTTNAQTAADMILVVELKAKLTKENDRFCYSIEDGLICGYGETPYKAAQDFNHNFYTKKP